MAEPFARPDAPLCLGLITYTAQVEAIDEQMAAHVDWLRAGFEAGVILLAGRRKPRVGGVVLFRGEREAVEKVASADPFVTSGVATVEVVPFNASLALPEIAGLLT